MNNTFVICFIFSYQIFKLAERRMKHIGGKGAYVNVEGSDKELAIHPILLQGLMQILDLLLLI